MQDELCLNVGFEISTWFRYVELDIAGHVLQRKESYLKDVTDVKSVNNVHSRNQENLFLEKVKFHFYYPWPEVQSNL